MEKKKIQPPFIGKRQVISLGKQLAVTIPKSWKDQHNIKKGDPLLVVANDRMIITIPTDEGIKKLHEKLK